MTRLIIMSNKRVRYIIFAFLLTVLYGVFPFIGFDWIENLELVIFNFRMNLRGPIEHSDKVIIVGIDDRSISRLYFQNKNPWPWTRDIYAKLVNRLGEVGVSSIVMDISFDSNDTDALERDRQFATSLFMHPYVTIGSFLINNKEEFAGLAPGYKQKLTEVNDYQRFRYQIANPEDYYFPDFFSAYKLMPPEDLFRNTAWAYGTYEIGLPASDGIYHSIPLVIQEDYLNEQADASMMLLPNIDILGLTAYYNLQPGEYVFDLKNQRINIGKKRSIPVDSNGYFTINYYGKRAFREIPVIDVLTGDIDKLAEIFKDKIVLIGYTAQAKGIFDARPTPFYKNEAGVQLHATVIENILDEDYLQRLPFWLNLILTFIILVISINILIISDLRLSIVFNLFFILAINFLNYILFINNIWADIFYLDLVLLLFLLANTIVKMYQENKERIKTKNYFARYVPAPVVEELLKDPSRINPGGEEKEITVLFSDIVGFTSISERLEPAELVSLLNEYLTEMTYIIKDHYQGTLDKFIGDAIVAIFGAPFKKTDDPLRAVRAALAMQKKAIDLQERWERRGEKIVFDLGIGINTGKAVVGNVGSPDRLNYTCIGDTVNVAARLEGATRETKTRILISEKTYQLVKDYFVCQEIKNLTVKGKKDPLTVYSVLKQKEPLT